MLPAAARPLAACGCSVPRASPPPGPRPPATTQALPGESLAGIASASWTYPPRLRLTWLPPRIYHSRPRRRCRTPRNDEDCTPLRDPLGALAGCSRRPRRRSLEREALLGVDPGRRPEGDELFAQIGRASCRERV